MKKATVYLIVFLGVMIISYFIATTIGENILRNNFEEEVSKMYKKVRDGSLPVVVEKDIYYLPDPVKRWLRYSEVIGKERVVSVRLKQKGFFKMRIDKDWIPFEAEEYYRVDEPSFLWWAKMKFAPFLYVTGRDKYYEGKGNMLIKIASLVTAADGKGDEINQGTLLRFLNEIMWFPSAALSNYITWEEMDKNSARATMSYGDVTASAIFFFDEKGAFINMTADRYSDIGDSKFSMEKWSTPVTEYGRINNILIPYKGSAIWHYKNGDFEYIRLEVTDIEYNIPSLYNE